MGGGGGKSKNKNRAGKTNKKQICAPEMFEKKNLCRDFNRENYKLVCILYIYNYKVQCKGVPQSWKISISIMF
jgi:hypothetical protein